MLNIITIRIIIGSDREGLGLGLGLGIGLGLGSDRLSEPNTVLTIIVSKMRSHCAGTVQMREESESGIRK